jgi:hypothetical protein
LLIPDPDPTIAPSRIRIPGPGVKKAPDPGSATLVYIQLQFTTYRYDSKMFTIILIMNTVIFLFTDCMVVFDHNEKLSCEMPTLSSSSEVGISTEKQ